MASIFPNGSTFAISAALSGSKVVTAITNANPGVASSTAHGFSDGDILVGTFPGRLDQRPFRVDNSVTNAFDLEGIDTSSTAIFSAGFGVGTVLEAPSFTSLSQTTDVAGSGGEQQFAQWAFIEDGRQRQRPTFKNARALQLTMHYDPSLSWHVALLAADLAGDVRVLKVTLTTGRILLYSVYVGFDGQPSIAINENMSVTATFALACPDVTSYAS